MILLTGIIYLFSDCSKPDQTRKLLDQALKNKDYATAAFAFNQLLLQDTANVEYKDSLSRIYIRSGNYEGGLRLGEQVMVKSPSNYKLLELISVANGQMKYTDKCIANLNTLYLSAQNPVYLYKIAGVYFDNNRFAEADSVADKLIALADSNLIVTINLPDGSYQDVKMLAACYNMKGAVLTEQAQLMRNADLIRQSVPYFQKALQVDPEFAYPRLYLEKISRYMQGGS